MTAQRITSTLLDDYLESAAAEARYEDWVESLTISDLDERGGIPTFADWVREVAVPEFHADQDAIISALMDAA